MPCSLVPAPGQVAEAVNGAVIGFIEKKNYFLENQGICDINETGNTGDRSQNITEGEK